LIKPKKDKRGFTSVPKHQRLKECKKQSYHPEQEKEALSLINQEKFTEAENLYRELIANGSNNHIVFGNLAALCGMRGKKDEIVQFLSRAITIEPQYAEAHNNLGVALQEKGDFNQAIRCFKKAIKIKPQYVDAFLNLANALKEKGDTNGAIKYFYQVIKIRPKYVEAYNNIANCYRQKGDISEAKKFFYKALKIRPKYAIIYNNLGNILLEEGDIVGAKKSFYKALKIKPEFSQAYNNLGNCFRQEGDKITAALNYEKSLKINPQCSDAYNNLGYILSQNGEIDQAIIYFNQAIKINPKFVNAYNNLGNSLLEKEDVNGAINSFYEALKLSPAFAEAHNNLGTAFNKNNKYTEAITSFKLALKYKPNFAKALFNLANTLQEIGDFEAAKNYFDKALEINPDYASAHLNLSINHLLLGNYHSGWDHYEWRWKCKVLRRAHAQPKIPKWDGLEILKEEKLLLITEQGLGDTMQFMRFVPFLRRLGFDCTFCAQTKLHNLIRASGIDANPITPELANKVSEGKWFPLLSLPKFLDINPNNPITTEPYIFSKIELVQKWKKILQAENKPIIGINWQGNPNAEKDLLRGRSLLLDEFSPIADVGNYKLLSLQKGFGSEQLSNCSFRKSFVSCQNQVERIIDFLEIAAIILNCDLIITSDTSVAHLAGGLGKKTWLLLKKIPEWRWGLEGEKTFWYPSMRLFRQSKKDNWHELMSRVSLELIKENGIKL
tara:strand:+ start:3419 stop:5590 length:2172 start_codon:yes stop_codon:yes gene_type:complete